MNVFENVEFLCGSIENPNDSIKQLFKLVTDLKSSLGEKSKLMDEYLLIIFEAVNSIDILSATDMANNLCSDALCACRSIIKGQPVDKKRQLYTAAKHYIESHPFDFMDTDTETKIYFYAVSVLIDNIQNVSKTFILETKDQILNSYNYKNINQKYKELTDIINEPQMEFLNSLLDKVFIQCPIIKIFVQAVVLKIVELILHQDQKTRVLTER